MEVLLGCGTIYIVPVMDFIFNDSYDINVQISYLADNVLEIKRRDESLAENIVLDLGTSLGYFWIGRDCIEYLCCENAPQLCQDISPQLINHPKLF